MLTWAMWAGLLIAELILSVQRVAKPTFKLANARPLILIGYVQVVQAVELVQGSQRGP
jgi:hypothetical protein